MSLSKRPPSSLSNLVPEFAEGASFVRIRYFSRTAFVNLAYAVFHSYFSFLLVLQSRILPSLAQVLY